MAEVEFTEWTKDDRLRHPSFKGLREDKPARKITREKPVALTEAEPARPTRSRPAASKKRKTR